MYRALRSLRSLRERVCFPFKSHEDRTFKLTVEQCMTLSQMHKSSKQLKLCVADAGHGKTWLMIALAFYKYLRYKMCDICVVFVIPSATILKFCEFWSNHIQFPAVSNYTGSLFYDSLWREQLPNTRALICSPKTAQDLLTGPRSLHNSGKVAIFTKSNNLGDKFISRILRDPRLEEFVVFGENDNNVPSIKMERFHLTNSTIANTIKPAEFECYNHVGMTKSARNDVSNMIMKWSHLREEQVAKIITRLSRHNEIGLGLYVKRNRAWWQSIIGKQYEDDVHEQNEKCLRSMEECPKMLHILKLAQKLTAQGKKLLVFDMDGNYIVHLYYLLSQNGISTYPYYTRDQPIARSKILADFEEQDTGVLIAPYNLILGDGISFNNVHHLTFFRLPLQYDHFDAIISKCSRPNATEATKVHLIFTCDFEQSLIFSMLEYGQEGLPISKFEVEIKKLKMEA